MTDAPAEHNLDQYAVELGRRARIAARGLAVADTEQKNNCIAGIAARLRRRADEVLAANTRDIENAQCTERSLALLDRLSLGARRIDAMIRGLEEIAGLPDPIGERIEGSTRPNGLVIEKVRVPLGVVLFIYESRPNVTTDAAALCVKSGNAVILRGGKEANQTNRVVHSIICDALVAAGLPNHAVQMVETAEHDLVDRLLQLPEYIDLVIPRGGEALIRRVAAGAKMPVMKHYQGICHVYVHEAADQEMARRIVLNSKCERPGTCNAAESLLVDRAIARDFLPPTIAALQQAGVEIRGCPETQALAPGVAAATEQDYSTEYLDLKMSVRVVTGLDEAIDHITRFGSAHTDAIVTGQDEAARQFTRRVDSSAVLVNASTRFNDGGEFGLGAEIGISTDKFHARGPCGVRELTSYKYVVRGDGQLRGA